MDPYPEKLNRRIEAAVLFLIVILITLLHYSKVAGSNALIHEISQRLYYIPIVYAAYRFGLRGSILISFVSGVIYLLHISMHALDSEKVVINQYAEVLMFQVVGIVTGLFAQAERKQRQRFEKSSADLAAAYKELKSTVHLLMRTARLKSLGELAATIAHEIRNPLGAIKGAVEIIEEDIPSTSPRREFVTVIKREVDRLNKLVVEFLNFAKPRLPEKVSSDLNEIIRSVVNFITPQAAKKSIRLVTQLDERLLPLLVDAEQIRQILLNLILNAIEATPQGGNIEILSGQDERFVRISVRDYGTGIEPERRERIFDPFFSTKQDGTGLGLSIAYQFVKQHGGEIELVEQNGPGSLFVLRLPLFVEEKELSEIGSLIDESAEVKKP
jgi:two-component system, NtrC family, sensor histidine kinase HydH